MAARYAFFDVDETLIGIKSMFSFRDFYYLRAFGEEQGAAAQHHAQAQLQHHIAAGLDRAEVNRLFWVSFRGFAQEDVRQAAQEWHRHVRQQPGYFIPQTLEALREHQRQGTEAVFVSGSCVEILEPLAAELEVRTLLAIRLEVEDGRFTGKLLPPQTIGAGKRRAIVDLLNENGVAAEECYGYGDHPSDLPLLEAVGYPRVLAGNAELVSIARQRGWPVLGVQEPAWGQP